MISELLILTLVLVLFLYWFRYNCVSILRKVAPRERTVDVAIANQLYFVSIQERLESELSEEEIDAYDRALLRDYEVLTSLLRYTSGLRGGYTVEQRILMIDFRLMRWLFAATRLWALSAARKSIEERTEILAHFAGRIAERSTVSASRP
ncbi:MAG: hypothetical protein ABSG25_06320 [Bryobacteraceae bacterium]